MGTLAAWIPAIITLLSVIFIAGQVTGRIKDQEFTIKDHDERLDRQDVRLGTHDVKIAESEAWRRGYESGKANGK